ncbi:MAG TPA: hypothetical protein VHO25_22065 [Polyangiaceae bacterium]|nr:hypothetical protein [Polyangiaceae bacterium]
MTHPSRPDIIGETLAKLRAVTWKEATAEIQRNGVTTVIEGTLPVNDLSDEQALEVLRELVLKAERAAIQTVGELGDKSPRSGYQDALLEVSARLRSEKSCLLDGDKP